jgi:hypothetical protein
MFCAVTCDQDAVAVTSLNIGNAVRNSNNVTLKNLHVDNVIPGATGADESMGPYFIDFAVYDQERPYDIRFNPGTLPSGSRVELFFPNFKTRLPRDKAVHRLKGYPAEGIDLPRRADETCRQPTKYNVERGYRLNVRHQIQRGDQPGLYGILPSGDRFSAAFFVVLPKGLKRKPGDLYTFHIEHWVGNVHVGGSSYEFRVREESKFGVKET